MKRFGTIPTVNNPKLSDFKASELTPMGDLEAASILVTPVQPRDLLLIGPCGHGKTHLARAIGLQLWRETGKRAIFLRVQDYIGLQYSHDREQLNVLEDAERCPILLLEDLGAEAEIKNSIPRVCALLSAREEHGRCVTIVTSNISKPSEVNDRLGERVASRLESYTRVLVKSENGDRRKASRGEVKQLD